METIQKIKRLRGAGMSYGAIAKMVGLSKSRIHQICEEMILKTPRMKKIIHLQHPFNPKKAKNIGSYDIIAKNSTLCWQRKGERTKDPELVSCKKCLFQMHKLT